MFWQRLADFEYKISRLKAAGIRYCYPCSINEVKIISETIDIVAGDNLKAKIRVENVMRKHAITYSLNVSH